MEETSLDHKFETIVSDPQLHLDFLDWYKGKTAVKVPEPFWQRCLPAIVPLIFFLFAMGVVFAFKRDRVEQEVYISPWQGPIYKTWVFVDGKIVYSWTDPVTISDSLKNARRIDGERILSTVR